MRHPTHDAKLAAQRRRKVLLVDRNDSRRDARLRLLTNAGYEVETSEDYLQQKRSANEGAFDLVIVALHREDLNDAAAYSERLRQLTPPVPTLLLTDRGVFIPRYALSHCIHAGHPVELLAEIAEMLSASTTDPDVRSRGTQLKAS